MKESLITASIDLCKVGDQFYLQIIDTDQNHSFVPISSEKKDSLSGSYGLKVAEDVEVPLFYNF